MNSATQESVRREFVARGAMAVLLVALLASPAQADPPAVAYLFPAGGQRGTQAVVRVGGLNLYDHPGFETQGSGVSAPVELARMPTIWFEGPLIKQPASQQKEDYPQDYRAEFAIAADAALGLRWCRARTAQGITPPVPFVVGDLPEVVEDEIDGEPLAVKVKQPVTINGRIFPREDVDLWSFEAAGGKSLTIHVAAVELGSPLEALLEVLDEGGRVLAESTGKLGRDPVLRFTPVSAGNYAVRIRDIRGSGLQNHVYRLTITDGPWLDRVFPLGGKRGQELELAADGQAIAAGQLRVKLPEQATGIKPQNFQQAGQWLNSIGFDLDELDEVIEPAALPIPGVGNGRIAKPGEIDSWQLTAKKSDSLKLEVRAARLGSPLDAVLVIKNAAGKELAKAEDLPGGSPDCELTFTAPEDGVYTAEVQERFTSRGGPEFAYRLRVTREQPGFDLAQDAEVLTLDVGTQKNIPVKVQRRGGFAGPIVLQAEGLPTGVSAAEVTIAANQNQGNLALKCEATTAVSFARVRIVGKGDHQGQPLTAVARRTTATGLPGEEELPLAITLAAPFKYKSGYELKYVPRGTSLKKAFQIERGTFEGPLRVQLAERQGRHLQGISGPVVTVPPGSEEFEYPVNLPPWMELGRTSRTNLMVLGEVRDASGKPHQVAWSTNEQNEQLIAIVSPPLVKLILEPSSLVVTPGKRFEVTVQIRRDPSLTEAIRLELVIPPHVKGVVSQPVGVAAGGETAMLSLQFGDAPGPFTAPLLLRGVAQRDGNPVVTETPLSLVRP